jgi:putative transposase
MEKSGCSLHAYALMTNHVHLLLTPREPRAVSRLMQFVGRMYVRSINQRYGRSGSLWEGRFRSSLVDSERYFLVCQRYVELNPVRAGLARDPRDYRWSSHQHYAGIASNPLLTEHECYLSLGTTPAERRAAYRQLHEDAPDPQHVELIRVATQKGRALSQVSTQSQSHFLLRQREVPNKPLL